MDEVRIHRTDAQGGHFAQVFIGDRFTGFTLKGEPVVPDDEVIARWRATGILVEEELSHGTNWSFTDIDIAEVVAFGAVRIVCEENGWDEREREYNPLLRIVTALYEEGSSHVGYTEVHSDEERQEREEF